MSSASNTDEQNNDALYYSLNGPTDELREQILAQFQETYEAAGKPEYAAMFDGVTSDGRLVAIGLTAAAARLFAELPPEYSNWATSAYLPVGPYWVWVAGDEALS